jgi:acyl carrier protein
MDMTQDGVYRTIQKVVCDSLGVEESLVSPNARLTEDLGAESIDYLDIAFRLEKAFGITIAARELVLSNVVSDPTYVQNNRITDAGINELRLRFPHLDLEELARTRDLTNLLNVFTVDTLARFVRAKLARCS